MAKKCKPTKFGLVRPDGEVYEAFRCLKHGVGGRWFRTREGRDKALEVHRAEFRKKSEQK